MPELPAVTPDRIAPPPVAAGPADDFLAVQPGGTLRLRAALTEDHKRVDQYKPAQGLKEAIDVAMLLGVPLLITGEPGTGKTSAAAWLARALGAGHVLPLDIKSGTAGRDLLYTFDEVARFRDSSARTERALIHYLQFSALGQAIVRAAGGGALLQTPDKRPLEGAWLERNRDLLRRAFGEKAEQADVAPVSWLLPMEPEFADAAAEHRIVLIDELDKAPRDTPNDLLAEINDMAFVIPELGIRVAAARGLRPIVLITSNSEKALPEPFLRRCAYFNIPEPSGDQLRDILIGTIPELTDGNLVQTALQLFRDVRSHPRVQKRPGTSELLCWLDVLHRQPGITAETKVGDACRRYVESLPEVVPKPARPPHWPLLGALMKSDDDIAIAMGLLLP